MGVFRMSSIDIFASGSADALHAVAACAKQKCAGNVDSKVDENAGLFDVFAISGAYRCDTRFIGFLPDLRVRNSSNGYVDYQYYSRQ